MMAACQRAETRVMLPAGPKVVFTSGADVNDHKGQLGLADRVHGKHPDVVPLYDGSPKAAELVASNWRVARRLCAEQS